MRRTGSTPWKSWPVPRPTRCRTRAHRSGHPTLVGRTGAAPEAGRHPVDQRRSGLGHHRLGLTTVVGRRRQARIAAGGDVTGALATHELSDEKV